MNTQLVEIQPRELKFIIEVKKQSSSTVHLANVTDQYIAFKVKTTSPKKYCVRPNVGIIKPKSTYSFTAERECFTIELLHVIGEVAITNHIQIYHASTKVCPSEMLCKDKFLIQSSVVPFGTTEEEITPVMFVKEGEKYIEETKLRVVLTSASNSPVSPVDGVPKQEASHDETLSPKEPNSPVLLPDNGLSKQERSYEAPIPEDKLHNREENHSPPDMVREHHFTHFPADMFREHHFTTYLLVQQFMKEEANKNLNNMEESSPLEAAERLGPLPAKAVEFYPGKDEESKGVKHVEEAKLKLVTDIEELKSKITAMDSKLIELAYSCEVEELSSSNIVHRYGLFTWMGAKLALAESFLGQHIVFI
ncbi:UNVERIFIED_CONTAM: Vesicle-associated protein 2-2 [Sesamum angustifolium]|uniref:Vesicle-associated protein 2-2 n=1 Tax=Sesamum angustifolium TaxID=2727405 RepID=A0AAW2LXL1_9LAMI